MLARVIGVASLLVACDALPPAEDGACGNKVVDPNEDCDTFADAPGAVCRPRGTTGQCRFACGVQPDKSIAVCPPGMGCGTDGTCRAPSGTYMTTSVLVEGTFSDVYVADVDGDARADVVGLEPGVISTTFFDAALATHTTIDTARRANVKVHPLVRDVSGDGRADLLVVSGNGTLVELGNAGRTFAPLAFPSTYLPKLSNAQLIVFDAAPPYRGDTLFIMGTYNGVSGIARLDPVTGQGAGFAFLSSPPSDLAGPVAIGHVNEDPKISPCGELAFSYVGSSEVDVFTACVSDGNGGYVYNDYIGGKMPLALALPAGTTVVRGPVLVDANADGHLDFLVSAATCSSGCDEIDVAYGAGDGTFTAFAPYPLGLMPDGKPAALPLAIGDLNGDGVLDHVTATQILVSQKNGNAFDFVTEAHGHGSPWTQAVIGDFNRDGIADVAAGSNAAPNVDFFLGAGAGVLDAFVIQTAPTKHFVVGDFDGDLVKDIAAAEATSSSDPLGDSVSVMFGNATGAPSAPISMGRFPSITQTTVGKFVDPFGVLSATDILLTSAELPNVTEFGTFAGSGDRVLRSPFFMNAVDATSKTATSAVPLRYTLGRFQSQSGPIQLAAIDDQTFPAPPPEVHRPWLMPLDAQGRLDMASTRNGDPAPDGIDWHGSAIVAVDLDGSGVDALVALGPSTDHTAGVMSIARAIPGTTDPQPRFSLGAPAQAPLLVSHVESDDPGAQSGRVVAADLDGDSKPDVVAVATIDGATSVAVLWNDHTGALGSPTVVPNPNGHAAIDFAVIDGSLAVLTDEAVTLVQLANRTPNVQPVAFPITGGLRIASGDVDGDGVNDLVVATNAGIQVFRGRAVRP